MEAASLHRGGSGPLQTLSEAARTRSRVFWLVAGLTLGAAVLRFATLGVQSYHHDEVVTASRILRAGFGHAMSAVGFSESTPPLYYALAWVWTQATGTGEWGLRSLSALTGILTVPVAALMKKARPIVAMTVGFAIASGSWLLIAAIPSIPVLVAAITLFALGEAMQAPRFYEYVADLAPREQVGTFMGFAFLPVALGSLVAGPLSGWLLQRYLQGAHRPAGMWITLAAIGFASTALMIVHDRMTHRTKPA